MTTTKETKAKIEELLQPLHEQARHLQTFLYWRVTQKDRDYITVLVTASDAIKLVAAADFVHSTIADAFPGASVAIVTSIDRS